MPHLVMTFSFLFSPFLPVRTIDTLLLRRRKGTISTYRTWPCTKTDSGNLNDQLVFFFLAAAKGILSLPTVTEQNERARHHSVPAILHNSKRKTSRLTVRRRSTRWNLIATNVQVRVFLKFAHFDLHASRKKLPISILKHQFTHLNTVD